MIVKAIERAYKVMAERNWNTIYWAIDLHGVCLESNYENGSYKWINEDALKTLQLISNQPENCIILWSSCYVAEQLKIVQFFDAHDITVNFFNCNAREGNTKTGCFDQKFYFSVLLDDKAGFDPSTDWIAIREFYEKRKKDGNIVYFPGNTGNG